MCEIFNRKMSNECIAHQVDGLISEPCLNGVTRTSTIASVKSHQSSCSPSTIPWHLGPRWPQLHLAYKFRVMEYLLPLGLSTRKVHHEQIESP